MSILDTIVRDRKNRIRGEGYAQGLSLPARRDVPIVQFGRPPFLICEIKRASPSRGGIATGADPVETAASYAAAGVKTVSVLTEQDRFAGSLEHLYRVKKAFPDLCVLRKDFLLDSEDLEVSFRAGADAVLLITSLHSDKKLRELYRAAAGMGLGVLLEVHSREDVARAASIRPAVTGINSRNLEDFTVDPAHPIRLRHAIDWDTTAVYESGISGNQEARVALSSGFEGLLVGEAVMLDPALVPVLLGTFTMERRDFWLSLFTRAFMDRKTAGPDRSPGHSGVRPRWERRTLVKVCGITNREDAVAARDLGADVLGFVFAESPRRADFPLLEELADLEVLKVGVVVNREGARRLDPRVEDLLERGLIDAVQLHGEERPVDCGNLGFPWYKAVRLRDRGSVRSIDDYRCPRVLVDGYVKGIPGGTGKKADPGLVGRVPERGLWLAGGLGPENIRSILETFHPELVDVSSLLEIKPGKKDHARLEAFFREVNEYEEDGKENERT